METRTNKYSAKDLEEFRAIIMKKLTVAREEYEDLKKSIEDNSTSSSESSVIKADNSTDVEEREKLSDLATRQAKFIQNLEKALQRIEQGTYGVCIVTGNLIAKERLRAVPHTNHSLEAKMKRL